MEQLLIERLLLRKELHLRSVQEQLIEQVAKNQGIFFFIQYLDFLIITCV